MKTIIIILLLGYFVPCLGFILVHFHDDWNKSWAKVRWWSVIYLLAIFGILTEWIMFFPAWLFRNSKINPFWIWLDDSRIKNKEAQLPKNRYAEDYYVFLKGKEETIWKAYQWHMRNRVWNFDSLFRPSKGERKTVKIVIDELFMNGEKIDQSLPWIPMARLKYWNDGVEGNQVNSGSFISKKYSIFGKGYIWETIGKRLTFRYSFNIPFLWMYWNFIAGENDQRYVFSFKPKRKLPMK